MERAIWIIAIFEVLRFLQYEIYLNRLEDIERLLEKELKLINKHLEGMGK